MNEISFTCKAPSWTGSCDAGCTAMFSGTARPRDQIIWPRASPSNDNAMLGAIGCRSRLGGLLNYYSREAV